MPLFYYSRLTEGGKAQADLQDPESEEKRSPVEPRSPGWLHDSLTAPSPPFPLPPTNKQWRRWIMRCWPWSKLNGTLSTLVISPPSSCLINLVTCRRQQWVLQMLIVNMNEGGGEEVVEGAKRGLIISLQFLEREMLALQYKGSALKFQLFFYHRHI